MSFSGSWWKARNSLSPNALSRLAVVVIWASWLPLATAGQEPGDFQLISSIRPSAARARSSAVGKFWLHWWEKWTMSNFRPIWASQLRSNLLVPQRAPEFGAMALVKPAGPGDPPPEPGELVGGVVEGGGLVVEVGLVVGVGRGVGVGGGGEGWEWGSRARRRNPSSERPEEATR